MFEDQDSWPHDELERDWGEPYLQDDDEWAPDPDSWYEEQYDLGDF